jgi:hypothetical protein
MWRKWVPAVVVASVALGYVAIKSAATITARVAAADRAAKSLADQFVSHVTKGRASEAYQLTSSAFQQSLNGREFGRYVKNWRHEHGELVEAKRVGLSMHGGSGGARAVLTYHVRGGSRDAVAKILLVPGSREWQVHACDYRLLSTRKVAAGS